MDGGERLRSADVLQQFDSGVDVRRRSFNGQGLCAPPLTSPPLSTCTLPPQNPEVSLPIRREADVGALALC